MWLVNSARTFDLPDTIRKTVPRLWSAVKARGYLLIAIVFMAIAGLCLGHVSYVPEYMASSSIEVQSLKKASLADHLALTRLVANDDIHEKLYWYTEHLKSEEFHYSIAKAIKFGDFNHRILLQGASETSVLSDLNFSELSRFLNLGSEAWTRERVEGLKISVLKVPIDKLARFVGGIMKITASANKIFVQVKCADSDTAILVANTIVKKFEEATNLSDSAGLENIQKVLKEKLKKTMHEMESHETQLISLRKQGLLSSRDLSKGLSGRINESEKEISEINIKLEENRSMIEKRKFQIKQAFLRSGDSEEQLERAKGFKTKVLALKKQIYLMRSQNIEEDHWRIQSTKKRLVQLLEKGQFHSEVLSGKERLETRDVSWLEKDVAQLKAKNEALKSRLIPLALANERLVQQRSVLPAKEQQFITQQRLVDSLYNSIVGYREKLSELEIRKLSIDKKVKVRSLAQRAARTKRLSLLSKLLFTFVVALFFGILLCFSLEVIDPHISSRSDLQRLGIDFLGEIPVFSTKQEQPYEKIFYSNPEHAVIFDFIRARLLGGLNEAKSTVILVTSASSGEGKSVTSGNLAASLAKMGKKTLLVDADLRRPTLHRLFKVINDQGFANIFEDGEPPSKLIIENCLPHMDFLPSGSFQNESTTFFCSDAFIKLMKYLRQQYDFIVFDSPPNLALPDAALIARQSDIVCALSKFGETTARNLSDVQEKIREISGADIKGLISFVPNREAVTASYPYLSNFSKKKGLQINYEFVESEKPARDVFYARDSDTGERKQKVQRI